MDLIVVAVVVVSISILFAYFQRKYSLNYWQSRNIPCIEPSFIHGNMENCGKRQHLVFVLSDIYNKFKGTGAKYCCAYFWSRPVTVILDLDLMRDTIIKDSNSFPDRGWYYNAKDDPLSANLVTLDGDELKKLRTKLTPTFTNNGEFTYEMLSELKYMEQVLRETSRKCPTSASLNRFEKYDYPVLDTNHVIEKGTWVKPPRLSVHHDPEIYLEPEKFDTDRFEANEFRKCDTMSLMAFGQDPRNCVAERFAFINMKIVVTMMLKNIQFLKCEKLLEISLSIRGKQFCRQVKKSF